MSFQDLQVLISPRFSRDHLLDIVKNYSDLKEISLGDINIKPSEEKIGDSYLSKIIRFTLNAIGINKRGDSESVCIHVITKILPPNLGRRKTFRSVDFFENEVIFYNKTWASIEEFYKSKNVEEQFGKIVPLFLAYHIDGENDFICLEDLSYDNYKSVERGNGINYFYTVQVMDLFAKFHSASLAFKDQKPEQFITNASSLKETYFSKKLYKWYGKFQENLFNVVRDAVKKELPPKYYEKLDNIFKKDFFNKLCDICENNHSHLSGITQGDAWIPNFLFQGDSDDDLRIALIDFQLARWAPFSNDITFFLLVCVEEGILVKYWDEFISEYIVRMKKYLVLLGSSADIIDAETFQEDIKKNITFTLAMALEALTMSLLDGFDLDVIQGDEEIPLESIWVIHPFKDEVQRRRVASIIKLIVDKGFI